MPTSLTTDQSKSSTPSAPSSDPSIQYSTFLHPSFEPDAFAHAVLKGEDYPPPTTSSEENDELKTSNRNSYTSGGGGGVGGDVSTALSKLNFGIEDLNRQLKQEIFKNHESLLLQVGSLSSISTDLSEVRRGLKEVEGNVEKLKKKIKSPFENLDKSLLFLVRLKRSNSLAKRGLRFLNLVKRLEIQMQEVVQQQQTTTTNENGSSSSTESTTEKRERSMAEAALLIAELETLLNAGESPTRGGGEEEEGEEEDEEEDAEAILPIKSLTIVSQTLPVVQTHKETILTKMQTSIELSLTREPLDPTLLASSLQTGYNLKVLPQLVDSLVKSLNDLVFRKVKQCFDMSSLAREISTKEQGMSSSSGSSSLTTTASSVATSFVYKSRTRLEPTSSNLNLWTSTMWNRLETLLNDLVSICIKVYTLEKVLTLKKDPTLQISFLEESLKTLENKPSGLFWITLGKTLELYSKELVKTSNFLQNLFSTGYPRLLRLFQEFFSKISLHTDTVYSLTQQSPETILVLRSIQPFESLYLNRCQNRLNESINSCFSSSSSTSLTASFTSSSNKPLSVPTGNEGLNLARIVVNELDAARFDPILVKQISKISNQLLETFLIKIESLVSNDYDSTSLMGPLATNSQLNNADLTSCLYHLWFPLDKTLNGIKSSNSTSGTNNNRSDDGGSGVGVGESVESILKPTVDRLKTSYLGIVSPLIMSIRREFSTILARMHKIDYSSSSSGAGESGSGTSSQYLLELSSKLNLIKSEILIHYRVGSGLIKDWVLDLSRFTVQTFLLHASILTSPSTSGGDSGTWLSEQGKLKLVQDTTFLEFEINNFLSGFSSDASGSGGGEGIGLKDMGDQFKALRAFRPLLFQETSTLLSPSPSPSPSGPNSTLSSPTSNVPTLILLHHIISRSSSSATKGGGGGGVEKKIPLPHHFHGWSEFEYVRWLNEHGERDRLGMIKGVLKDWQLKRQQEQEQESREGEEVGVGVGVGEEDKKWRDWVGRVLSET
ncbi:hypothetical protein JCM5350_000996 [Sporobolomyces pararoseus]